MRLALSGAPAAPDLNPQPLPPGFVGEFRSLTPDITVTKGTDCVGTQSGVAGKLRKSAGGNPDLVFSPDPIYMQYSTSDDSDGDGIND